MMTECNITYRKRLKYSSFIRTTNKITTKILLYFVLILLFVASCKPADNRIRVKPRLPQVDRTTPEYKEGVRQMVYRLYWMDAEKQ